MFPISGVSALLSATVVSGRYGIRISGPSGVKRLILELNPDLLGDRCLIRLTTAGLGRWELYVARVTVYVGRIGWEDGKYLQN